MNRLTILLLAVVPLCACGSSSSKPDTDPEIVPIAPTSLELVAAGSSSGFEGAMDAVASPDGSTFYFTAYTTEASETDESKASVFKVPAAGGTASLLVTGEPLEDPSGLLMSCDGGTLFVADMGNSSDEASPIYSVSTETGAITEWTATGVGEAAGLAMSTDCSTIYVTGYDTNGTPAVFKVPLAGGVAEVLLAGAPLESPTGVYVDSDSVAWVMDHKTSSDLGGVLWAIDDAGAAKEVIGGLGISEPAGVSLVAGGRIAVIPNRDENGESQLITVDTVSGESTIVDASEMIEPAGIRTAINASVMVVVDADGNSIYRAQ